MSCNFIKLYSLKVIQHKDTYVNMEWTKKLYDFKFYGRIALFFNVLYNILRVLFIKI